MKIKGGHPRNTVYGTHTVKRLQSQTRVRGISHSTVTLLLQIVSL